MLSGLDRRREGWRFAQQLAYARSCVADDVSMPYNIVIRNRPMTQDLRTSNGDAKLSPPSQIDCQMGLVNHVGEFVSLNGGEDGKPTPYRVAKDAGISTNTIYRLVNKSEANLSPQVLGALCKALDCQPGDLLSYEPEG